MSCFLFLFFVVSNTCQWSQGNDGGFLPDSVLLTLCRDHHGKRVDGEERGPSASNIFSMGAHFRDILPRFSAPSRGNGSSTSSAAILLCFTIHAFSLSARDITSADRR